MDYLLFTYPNCRKCEDLKAYLKGEDLSAETLDVSEKEGRTRIRAFLPQVKRDEKGSIILPTLICHENDRVRSRG
jgi:glutaredoxin